MKDFIKIVWPFLASVSINGLNDAGETEKEDIVHALTKTWQPVPCVLIKDMHHKNSQRYARFNDCF